VKLLAELLPEIKQLGEPLLKAELPGILRDKKTLWKENTTKLKSVIDEYTKASSPVDSLKLLDAAEQLHMQYEKLVRIVRPAMKEMDEFHTALYSLYHYYLPEENKEKIASSIKELKMKMEALNKAKLSERMKKRETAFTDARTKLSKSVDALNSSSDMKLVKKQIETMHSDYQSLEKVFE
jgi:organic radical activating enzyme